MSRGSQHLDHYDWPGYRGFWSLLPKGLHLSSTLSTGVTLACKGGVMCHWCVFWGSRLWDFRTSWKEPQLMPRYSHPVGSHWMHCLRLVVCGVFWYGTKRWPLQDEVYFTIHVTPQVECSFASFETNLPKESYSTLISDVIAIFKPGKCTVTVYASKVSYAVTFLFSFSWCVHYITTECWVQRWATLFLWGLPARLLLLWTPSLLLANLQSQFLFIQARNWLPGVKWCVEHNNRW